MSQKHLALETNRTYIHEIPKATAIQQRVKTHAQTHTARAHPRKGWFRAPKFVCERLTGLSQSLDLEGGCSPDGCHLYVLSLCLFQLGRNFFLNFKIFFSLILIFIFPSGTICLPVLLLPCFIQWIPFLFLLLNLGLFFFLFFYWTINAIQCCVSFCCTMQ